MKSTFNWSRILLTGASMAAIGAVTPAVAQDVSEEIVVTATGRTAAIQDVPVAVTAIGGETVQDAGVENLLDMQQLAPSLRIGAGQSTSLGTTARIRALGTGGDNPGFESAVGFFIDGVFRARAGIAISDLPEVERIEILRGPQGTLYGRNTSSGAISVTTRGPSFEPGMWIEGGYGDLEYAAMRAGGDIPLSDSFAIRLDGSLRARDGYLTDFDTGQDYNTQNRWSLRGQAVWDINQDASLRVIVDRAETDEDCCAATVLQYGATQAILDDSYLALAGGYAAFLPSFGGTTMPNTGGVVNDPGARFASVSPARDYLEQVEDGGVSAQLDWDLGGVNLTSITAYREWEANRGQDIDFNNVDLFYRENLFTEISNFSQEIRLQGEFGRVNWLVGVYYSNESLSTTDRIRYGADASNYGQAAVFGNTAAGDLATALATNFPAFAGPYELFDATSAGVDTVFFGGTDPVPSVLRLAHFLGTGTMDVAGANALAQVYLTPNPAGSGQQADAWSQDAEDIAIFTHNEISLSDALTWTVGLRYGQSEKNYDANLQAFNPMCDSMQTYNATFTGLNIVANGATPLAPLAGGVRTMLSILCAPQGNTALGSTTSPGIWNGSRDEDAWSGTTALRYEVNDDLMLYGSYSRGYKAGGYNLDRSGFVGIFPGMTPAQASALIDPESIGFEPEYVDSYELGMRSTILNGSTFFNVTLFHSQLHDYQLNAFNGTAFITRNIPEAISQGVEIDILARLTDNLTIQGGVNYTDAYNDSTVAFAPSPADTIFEGTPLVQAPEWSVTGAITYEMPINDSLLARFYLDGRYDTEYQTQALGRNPISDQDDVLILNGRIGLGSPNQHWSVEFWGRNLTDEVVWGGFNLPLQTGSIGAFVNEPRTYGVTVRARY